MHLLPQGGIEETRVQEGPDEGNVRSRDPVLPPKNKQFLVISGHWTITFVVPAPLHYEEFLPWQKEQAESLFESKV